MQTQYKVDNCIDNTKNGKTSEFIEHQLITGDGEGEHNAVYEAVINLVESRIKKAGSV